MIRWIWLLLFAGCLYVVEPDGDSAATSEGVLPVGEVHPCTITVENTSAYWTICFAKDEDVHAFEREMMDNCEYNGINCNVTCSAHELWPCAIICPGVPLVAQACNSSYGCYCPRE